MEVVIRRADPEKPAAKAPRKRAPRAYHHGDLRRALLDAALIVVRDHGVDAVRMNALAKTLRVSVAAPFRHFPSREALLVALAEEGAVRMVDAINAAVTAVGDAHPLLREQARGVAYVRFVVAERGYFRLLARAEILALSPMLQSMSAAQESLMDDVLGRHHRGVRSPLIARSAGVLAAQALTYGLARMITDGLLGDVSVDDAEVLATEVTNVLGEGLMAMPSPEDEDVGGADV
jgi:AcrR family transcriptional regulator